MRIGVTHKAKGTMNRRSNQEKSNRKEKREPIGPLSAPARDYGDGNCRLTLEAIGRVGGPRKGIGRWKGSLLHQVSEPNSLRGMQSEIRACLEKLEGSFKHFNDQRPSTRHDDTLYDTYPFPFTIPPPLSPFFQEFYNPFYRRLRTTYHPLWARSQKGGYC